MKIKDVMFILKLEEFLGISFLCLDVDGVPDEDKTLEHYDSYE